MTKGTIDYLLWCEDRNAGLHKILSRCLKAQDETGIEMFMAWLPHTEGIDIYAYNVKTDGRWHRELADDENEYTSVVQTFFYHDTPPEVTADKVVQDIQEFLDTLEATR